MSLEKMALPMLIPPGVGGSARLRRSRMRLTRNK